MPEKEKRMKEEVKVYLNRKLWEEFVKESYAREMQPNECLETYMDRAICNGDEDFWDFNYVGEYSDYTCKEWYEELSKEKQKEITKHILKDNPECNSLDEYAVEIGYKTFKDYLDILDDNEYLKEAIMEKPRYEIEED